MGLTPCGDKNFKRLCSEYSDTLPHCDVITTKDNVFRDRAKILWGKADCLDLFELKNELLRTKKVKFKTKSFCMFPVLAKGDILKVKSASIDDINIGDIPVYRSQDRLYAHRVVDKKIIDGRQFIITRPDTSRNLDGKDGEQIAEENILGKIEEIQRGRKISPLQKRKATIWETLLYKRTNSWLRAIALWKEFATIILIKLQSLKAYRALGRKLAVRMEPQLNFELVVPFSNPRLSRLHNRIVLNNQKFDFEQLKQAKIFHLVMKFKNDPIGCVSCYQGGGIADIYIRLRYRDLGLDLILLAKAEQVFKKAKLDTAKLSLPPENLAKKAYHLNDSEELLLICARKDLDEDSRRKAQRLIQEGLDWQRFTELTMKQGVTILVYDTLRKIASSVPTLQEVLDRLKSGYVYIATKATSQHQELLQLLKLFAQKEIPVIPLKGTLLAKHLYGDAAARGVSVDFDLLLKEEDREKAQALLQEVGYSVKMDNEIKQWQWYYSFSKPKGAMIELHWDITMMGRTQERITGLWNGTRQTVEDGVSFFELKEEELLLYLAAHLVNSSHFNQLRYVCDINELLHKYHDRLEWGSIVEKARRWRVSSSVYVALNLSKSLFGSEVPKEALRGLRPNFLKLILIKIFTNRKVSLRSCLRRRLIDNFLSYVFFELIEAKGVRENLAVVKRVLFPPEEVLLRTKSDSSKSRYIIRFFTGVFKVLRRCIVRP